nr:hypothetical protein [Tanacetum cinerariifolium]
MVSKPAMVCKRFFYLVAPPRTLVDPKDEEKKSGIHMVEDFDFVLPIEAVNAVQNKFANSLVGFFVAVPIVDATKEAGFETIGYTKEKIRVEYEWKPPVCHDCHIFGHTTNQCLKHAPTIPKLAMDVANDGFTIVVSGLRWRSCCGGMMLAEVVSVMVVTSGYWWICSVDDEVGEAAVVGQPTTTVAFDGGYGVVGGVGDTVEMETKSEVKELVLEGNPNVFDVKGASTPYDDVLMFSIADWNIWGLNRAPKQSELASARVILESLDEFKMVSGLVPSITKSTA